MKSNQKLKNLTLNKTIPMFKIVSKDDLISHFHKFNTLSREIFVQKI